MKKLLFRKLSYKKLTEYIYTKKFLSICLTFCAFLSAVLLSFLLYQKWQDLQKLLTHRSQILSKISYNKKLLQEYPGSRDLYLNLALLSYQIGDIAHVKYYEEKVFSLDPNFKKGREIVEELENGK